MYKISLSHSFISTHVLPHSHTAHTCVLPSQGSVEQSLCSAIALLRDLFRFDLI